MEERSGAEEEERRGVAVSGEWGSGNDDKKEKRKRGRVEEERGAAMSREWGSGGAWSGIQESMKKYFTKVSNSSSGYHSQPNREENVNHLVAPLQFSHEFDLSSLEADPGERTQILDFHPNHRDAIRRDYLQKRPCQPQLKVFPQTLISGDMRRFNRDWYVEFPDWNWNKKDSLAKHIGGPNSIHSQSKRKCEDLIRQQQSIHAEFDKQLNQDKHGYEIRLAASIRVVRLLVKQGLAFRGHDESKASLNRGNFLEILSFYAQECDKIRSFVLEKAPQNDQMTCPMIQKEIVLACKIETIKGIIKELNGDYFSLLVDESFGVSRKDQMAVVLRYVDRRGFVMERLLDIVHVKNTSALALKGAIVNLLSQHSLSLSCVRGQCYDGASNMQGDINGLKMLIKKESRSAHSIHCFAHQLQLTLVGVSKKCLQVGELVHLVSDILNVLAASYKRMDEYRESQRKRIQEALEKGELKTGRGLHQELGISRACDTRWGSHFKSFNCFILQFGTIMDVLDTIVETAHSLDESARATGYIRAAQTYEVAFMLHLMKEILGITNDLSTCLQKKEQDIANAMRLVNVARIRLQELREDKRWDLFVVEVSTFCVKYNIVVPNFDESYVNSGRFRHVFCKIIDWQLQELNDRFDEETTELLYGVACLNPIDSFSSFDIQKIMRMAKLYPDDFDEFSMCSLENQLANYIIDVRDIDKRFSDLNGLCDLSKRLVQTKKHSCYPLVFRLVKFSLLLPVATASVERAFSAMKFIKNELRSRMNDEFLSGCMVPFVEKDMFNDVSNDDIILTFQAMKPRRVVL
ncbi:uncharacterized protein LOC132631474 [Lycium barbarum]|uniref:uncharacterized protein LOC132631474 n=1 Tax=Lycium barbarum TaxID=112863 RepID=UPI00293E9E86|nr:uncharacterized protein LOC132631474 [Lycium barbarum]